MLRSDWAGNGTERIWDRKDKKYRGFRAGRGRGTALRRDTKSVGPALRGLGGGIQSHIKPLEGSNQGRT